MQRDSPESDFEDRRWHWFAHVNWNWCMKVMPSKCCNLKLNYDAFMFKYVLTIKLIQNFQVNIVPIGRLGKEGYSTKGESTRWIKVPFLQDLS